MYHYDNGYIYNCHKCKHVAIVPGCIYHKDYHPSENNYPCDWKGERIMTQEEKKLLLKDICPRLLYGLKFQSYHSECGIEGKGTFDFEIGADVTLSKLKALCESGNNKPYLRPLSSMTDEERDEFRNVGGVMAHNLQNDTWAISAFTPEAYDWLNEYHFDWRGLIPMGLALEASVDMYKQD